jgi:hypothetical protein
MMHRIRKMERQRKPLSLENGRTRDYDQGMMSDEG